MKINRLISFAIALAATLMVTSIAHASGPYGTWLRAETGAHLQVFKCKGGLGMKVTKSKEKENLGKVIMCGAKADGENKWKGSLLNLEDGKTYKGVVTLQDAKTLVLEGCVLGGLFCKAANLQRVN